MHDIVIRNGTIVDGSGKKPFVGDIAIDGNKITTVGEVNNTGQKEIDAKGKVVTPGWVDIHTHYDGQVCWDPYLTPSSWHGVTTALIGNCGMTFAPCHPEHRELLAGMMETVEDIPKEAFWTVSPGTGNIMVVISTQLRNWTPPSTSLVWSATRQFATT